MTILQTLLRLCVVVTLVALTGCATVAGPGTKASAEPVNVDPWENWNRKVFAFNEGLDEALIKPAAKAYRDAVPALVRTGVSNVFGNINDAWSAANHLLQGKVGSGLEMGFRVLTNTLLGFGGVLDPATEFGMTKRSEDFGQTLGRWGFANGPFLVLPVLGPQTVRDTAGFLVDRQASASRLPDTSSAQWAVVGLEVVDIRTRLLGSTQLLDQIALDKYSFVRDAYLSRRRDSLFDGAPPLEDDFADEPAKPAAAAPAGAAVTPGAAQPGTAPVTVPGTAPVTAPVTVPGTTLGTAPVSAPATSPATAPAGQVAPTPSPSPAPKPATPPAPPAPR